MKLPKLSFSSKITALVIAVAAATGVTLLNSSKVDAAYVQDCSSNSIMKCGAGTPSQFISKTKANAPGDLPTVFADFGLVTSEHSRFVSTAKAGTLYKSGGKIVVNGQVVATNAWSIGREAKSYSWTKSIGGKTYHASYSRDVMLNDTLPVMVMFNAKGQMEFAVMNACGNPLQAAKVTPSYSCDLLTKTAVSGKKDTYKFTTKASAANNAKVVKLVYNFGDGTSATATSTSQAVEHTYSKPGNYTATVTVYVSLPGSNTVTTTSAKCKTVITVAQPKVPFQECVVLTGTLLNKEQHNYQFVVTTRQGNGSVLKNATFNFGDGVTAANVAPSTTTTVRSAHAYAKEGKYTITATVNFTTAAGVKSVTCTTAIDTGITPVCPYNPQLPPNSPECKKPETPQVLPATGPAGLIGLFTGTSLFAGLGYRFFLSRRNG